MILKSQHALLAVVGGALLIVATASATRLHTTAPSHADRAGILKAFGDPAAASPCLTTRLAESNHSYATVLFKRSRKCLEWDADGVNVFNRVKAHRWRERFEGSSYRCPIANVPKQLILG